MVRLKPKNNVSQLLDNHFYVCSKFSVQGLDDIKDKICNILGNLYPTELWQHKMKCYIEIWPFKNLNGLECQSNRNR